MKGTIVLIVTDRAPMVITCEAMPSTEMLHKFVGGYIEVVPFFTSIEYPRDGVRRRCVAFCNEDGKRLGLPRNNLADLMWRDAIVHDPPMPGMTSPAPDFLVGTVIVLYGDLEFMNEL